MFGFWGFGSQQTKYKSAEDRLREQLTTLEQVNASLRAELDVTQAKKEEDVAFWKSEYNRVVESFRDKYFSSLETIKKLSEQVKQLQESLAASISERDTMDTWNRGLSVDVERLNEEVKLLKSDIQQYKLSNSDLEETLERVQSVNKSLKTDISQYEASCKSYQELLAIKHNELKDYKDSVDALATWHLSKKQNQPAA